MVETIDLTKLLNDNKNATKKIGKFIIEGGSQGGGATQEIKDNIMVDINITLNLNLGDKIDSSSMKQLEKILDKIMKIKSLRDNNEKDKK